MLQQPITATQSIDLTAIAAQVAQALQSHNWTLLIGLVLMVVIYGLRQLNLVAKLPAKWIPWATMGLAVIGSAAAAVVGGKSLLDAILAGVGMGASAIAAWELGGQHVLPTSSGATPASPAPPAP